MIVRAVQIATLGSLALISGTLAVWFADIAAPSIVTPIDVSLTRYGDRVEMTYCLKVERFRGCPFYIGRSATIGDTRILISGEWRPPLDAPKTIPRTCRSIMLSRKASSQHGAELTAKLRLSYACNPLRQIWPIVRNVEFKPTRIP